MTYTLDTTYLIIAGLALLLGLLIGLSLGGGARRRAAALAEKVRALELDIDVREAERVRLQRELASASDQVRPLSDEVDRLKRERDQRKSAAANFIAAGPETTDAAVVTSATVMPAAGAPVALSDPTSPSFDNLTLLKGVGDRFAAKLNEIGITRFRQIADWSADDEAAADARLDTFRGRLARDRVVEQAKLLADGRVTEYEARFGKLGAPA